MLLKLLFFVGTFALVVGSEAIQLECEGPNPELWVNRLSRCYYFSNETASTWYSAMESCYDLGGRPLSIESAAEKDNIRSYINSMGAAGDVSWWTSGANLHKGRSWIWYGSGREVVYKDYCNDMADGSVNHCFVMDFECDYSWSVADCNNSTFYYICEKDVTRY